MTAIRLAILSLIEVLQESNVHRMKCRQLTIPFAELCSTPEIERRL
jgi:hypothetical protein